MQQIVEEIQKVHRQIDNFTESWVAEPERDEKKWKDMVEVFLLLSSLPRDSFPFMNREAEAKKRWELHLKGELPKAEDEFATKESGSSNANQ